MLRDAHRLIPHYVPDVRSYATADVNGDGHQDLVVTGYGVAVLLGSAEGVFRDRPDAFPKIDEVVQATAFADLDGDGDLDCACACSPGTYYGQQGYDRVLFNDGTGKFSHSPHGPISLLWSHDTSIAAGDIDGDGDADLLIGSPPPAYGATTRLYLNNGAGQFTLDSSRLPHQSGGTNVIVMFDQDGDGDLDVYFGNKWGPTGILQPSVGDQLFRNNGTGFFTQAPLLSYAGNNTLDVYARDFDGDGDVDIMARQVSTSGVPVFHYYRNDAGVYTDFVPVLPPGTTNVLQSLVGDWNADGMLDFAVRVTAGALFMVQTTPGHFTHSTLPPLVTGDRHLFAHDFEGDGDSDILASTPSFIGSWPWPCPSTATWFRNLGTAWNLPPVEPLPPGPSGSWFQLHDFDRDGHLDFLGSPHGRPGSIWRGDSSGRLTAVPASQLGDFATAISSWSGTLLFGDLDGDGDTDIVCTSRQEPYTSVPTSRLYWNTPSGLSVSVLPWHAEQGAVGDIDGDNDLDVVLFGFNTRIVMKNNGSGVFTTSTVTVLNSYVSRRVILADFDGDTDLDVGVVSNGYLANDGTGTFTLTPIPALSGSTIVIPVDVDGDGDLDIVDDGTPNVSRSVLRNNGAGGFIATPMQHIPGSSLVLGAADLDNDGLPELIENVPLPNGSAEPRILHNLGNGAFKPLRNSFGDWLNLGIFESGDIDGDGDLDVFTGTLALRNQHHQVERLGWPIVGCPLRIGVSGRACDSYTLGVALTLAPTPLVLPGIGRLWLDPASIFVVANGNYGPDGQGMFVAAVPNDPQLIGLTLYWQALSAGSQLHLSNLETTTLAPR